MKKENSPEIQPEIHITELLDYCIIGLLDYCIIGLLHYWITALNQFRHSLNKCILGIDYDNILSGIHIISELADAAAVTVAQARPDAV